MIGHLRNQIFYVTAWEQRQNHVRHAFVLAKIMYSYDIRVIAETSHGLGFTFDARPGVFIQLFRFDLGKGDVAVKHGVVDEVNPFPAPLAEELSDLIAAGGEGDGLRGNFF